MKLTHFELYYSKKYFIIDFLLIILKFKCLFALLYADSEIQYRLNTEANSEIMNKIIVKLFFKS